MNYKTLVYIGRFQPFTLAHKHVVDYALPRCEELVIVLGSAESPRTLRNPFNDFERVAMITREFGFNHKIRIERVPDRPYNEQRWMEDIRRVVNSDPDTTAIVGMNKDASSYYLSMFPEWDHVDCGPYHDPKHDGWSDKEIKSLVNATEIRSDFYEGTIREGWVPKETRKFLEEFCQMSPYQDLVVEHEVIKKYKESWANTPYPVTFVTVDAVIVQAGHVLMVTRDAHPGRGLQALPGGFVNVNETLEEAVIREIREETNLRVPVPTLKAGIKERSVFDEPKRSERGRTITHAFLFDLSNEIEYQAKKGKPSLSKVKSGSDARAVSWVPLNELRREECFEDHFDIIETMIDRI